MTKFGEPPVTWILGGRCVRTHNIVAEAGSKVLEYICQVPGGTMAAGRHLKAWAKAAVSP